MGSVLNLSNLPWKLSLQELKMFIKRVSKAQDISDNHRYNSYLLIAFDNTILAINASSP